MSSFISTFSPQSICLVMIGQTSASHKGQLIEVTCTETPSDAVTSAVHRVVKNMSEHVEQRDSHRLHEARKKEHEGGRKLYCFISV